MDKIFVIGELTFYPYLLNKDTLAFTNTIIGNDKILLNEEKRGIDINVNNKHYLLKLSNEEYKRALEYKEAEQKCSKKFFNSMNAGTAKIQAYLLEDGEYWIRPLEAWDRGYSPYWDKIFRYMVEKYSKSSYINNDKEDEFQRFLNKRFSFGFNPTKYKQSILGTDKYIELNFKDFIDIII